MASRLLCSLATVLVGSCLLVLPVGARQNPGVRDRLTADQWREDLSVLEREMRARHANLSHTLSPSRFDQSIRSLKRQAPGRSPLEMVISVEAIVASVRDGHTRVVDNRIGYRRYPLRLYWYRDGVFVQAAHQLYREAIGGRVVRVGGLAIDQAIERVATVVPRDNDFALRERVPWRLVTPEILAGLGILKDMARAQYEVERDGRRLTIEVAPLSEPPQECQGLVRPLPAAWVEARQAGPYPLWLRSPCEAYWFEYLPAERLLYVQVNEVQNRGALTLEQFFRRVFDVADPQPVERVVLDLRLNPGGNLELLKPVLTGLIRRDFAHQRGRFFTIIGRRTFSAAQYWVNELEKYTETIFVGEPTAEAVNFYGDAEVFSLPNSGIRVAVSAFRWQQMFPWDDRLATTPGIPAELTSADFWANRDPALAGIRP